MICVQPEKSIAGKCHHESEPLAGQKGDRSLQQMLRMDIIEEMSESVLVSAFACQGAAGWGSGKANENVVS